MNIDEKLITRIDQLISKGEDTKKHYIPSPPGVIGGGHVDYSLFNEWKNNSENIVLIACGKESSYYTNFVEHTKNPWPEHVEQGIGILKALKEDIETGFISNVKELVTAEVFVDFLDMAKHLLEAEYKDPAASLIGAVLEDGLRKISLKNNIEVKDGDDISALNTKLGDKNIYNRLVQQQIQAWKVVRDRADHGKFDEYKKEDVEAMLEGVQRFLTTNI